ncbi:DUF3105 domain-containing protein [Candidatus Berkelbacteria bacterium]|nr:DUF3105 domain-containing protein [Candidatus Berkelbacteria bacterium]
MNQVIILITTALILIVLGGVYLGEKNQPQNLSPLGKSFDIQGAEHIAPQAPHAPYNSNPPSSGWHWEKPADWGIYDYELADEQLVHNLEHGGVNLFYKPEAAKEVVEKLKELARLYPAKTVLAPRAKNDTLIALSSWGYVLNLDSLDEEKIKEFLKNNRNRGPEKLPD